MTKFEIDNYCVKMPRNLPVSIFFKETTSPSLCIFQDDQISNHNCRILFAYIFIRKYIQFK